MGALEVREMVGVKTHSRDPGQDLAMDCRDQEGEGNGP